MLKRRILILLAFLIAVQVLSWAIFGRNGPLKALPRMIEMDLQEVRRAYGDHPDEVSEQRVLVLCPELADALSSSYIRQIQDSLAEFDRVLIHDFEAPPDWFRNGITKPGFTQFCAEVSWQTPLVAQVEVAFWNGPLAAGGMGHRTWFIFGFWVATRANSSWVS